MTNIILSTIQIKRGTLANMPALLDGELYYAYDVKEYHVGMSGTTQLLSKDFQTSVLDAIQSLKSSNGTGALVYNTVADLQTAYPNGKTQPAWVIADNCWYYWSGTIVTDTTPPVDITGLTVGTVTPTSIPLTWTKSTSTDVDHYEVSYSSNGGSSYTVASSAVNSSSTSYTISGLTASTNYMVRVVAIDTSSNRSTGVTATATTSTPSDTTPPNDVTNLATSNVTSTSLTLSWTASNSSDIASYDVYQGSTLLGNTTNTTYNVNSLSASTQYTFKVVAKDTSGNASTGVTVTQTTSVAPDTTPPTVTISPAAGTYTSTQSVTLTGSDNSGGAVTIYYTTDGSTPTTSSSVYSSPISVSATETIKYFGVDGSGNASAVQSATYTINASSIPNPLIILNGQDSTALSGSAWTDASGNGNNATFSGSPSTSMFDSTLGFEATSAVTDIQLPNTPFSGTTAVTFEFITKPESTLSYPGYLLDITNGTNFFRPLWDGPTKLTLNISPSPTITEYTVPTAIQNQYIHVVWVLTTSNVSMYVNGTLAASANNTGITNWFSSATTGTISLDKQSGATKQRLKRFRAWNKALASTDVTTIYTQSQSMLG